MALRDRIPDDDATRVGGVEGLASSSTNSGSTISPGHTQQPIFEPGTILVERYEILQLLGQGGMGAVYKATDRELDRLVALKTIRPEMAGNAEMLARFKQEIILARQITHRNVIRIYDIGESAGTKFITMEYVEGEDLRSLLQQKGKFPPLEAVEIIQQVCRALEAAHAEGVIHRDLKPQNVMRDQHDRIVVMDFGLARPLGFEGLTQTGALVGTMEYMSPEQALGIAADARSDVFAIGLIFYELLTGITPYKADTAIASLLKRSQEAAVPVSKVDTSIPPALSNIVGKCLERDCTKRYQSSSEILKDLDLWRSGSPVRTKASGDRRATLRKAGYLVASTLLLVALLAGAIVLRHRLFGGAAQKEVAHNGPVLSVAVLPFRNATGDAALDWIGSSLSETLSTDVGQSSTLHIVSADRVYQVLRDLRISPGSEIDDSTLRRIAEFSSADRLLWGQYAKVGNAFEIQATLQDLKSQHSTSLKARADDQNQLLAAVDRLAHSVQENLSLPASAVRDIRAAAFAPSTKSADALRAYTEGLQLERQGNHLEAQKRFEDSTKQDPEFALAYSKLGQTYAELGYANEAATASRKAVDLSSGLPEHEKQLIRASHARIINDTDTAIRIYEELAKVSPEDSNLQFALADLYLSTGAYDKAREQYAKVLVQDPKSVDALLGMGKVETVQLNPQDSIEYLNRALALTIQFGNDERRAKVLQDIAVAYRQLNKPDDALRYAQESLDIRRRLGQKQGIAESLHTIAQIQTTQGKMDLALKEFEDAIRIQRDIGDNRGLADTLIDYGNLYNDRSDYDRALKAYKESLQLERNLGDRTLEAVNLNNIAIIYVNKAQYDDALSYYEQALHLREQLKVPTDIADTLHNLGDVATSTGQNDRAVSYYLRALEIRRSIGDRRGEAMDSQSIAFAFEQQGRYGAALKSTEDAVKTFRDLQEHGFWLAEVLAAYGNALNQVGRLTESQTPLAEALALARELKNQDVIAEVLNYQGDRMFYHGDFRSARGFYEQSLKAASHPGADPNLLLTSKINLAKASMKEGDVRAAVAKLNASAEEARTLGLTYLETDANTYVGEGLLNLKDYSHAREELESALEKSEKSGFRALTARSRYLLANTLRASGSTIEADHHLEEARRTLDDIAKESGNGVLTRSDFAPISAH